MTAGGLDAERHERGWRVHVPVNAEDVSVQKRAFVVEEVEVRRELVEDVEPVTETVRREELRVETRGELEATQRLSNGRRRTTEESAHE